MMAGTDDTVKTGLMKELIELEEKLDEVYQRLKKDQAEFGIISRKYAAMRDMVTKYLGRSPYEPETDFDGLSPIAVTGEGEKLGKMELYGGFRFIYMPIGKAVISALKETTEALSLEEIVKWLQTGGIEREKGSLTRAVNAALMRTKGIYKTKDGKYFIAQYVEEEVEPEDLPF